MDALYVLGNGSQFNDMELKYSMRSLERYGSGIDRVIIIGERPAFLNYDVVVHHPFEQSGPKDYRIASKVLFACENGIVSGDFLFLNDDFFFTKAFDARQYPYFQKGELLTSLPRLPYEFHLQLTRDFLKSKGKATLHFDVHTPIIYNSEKFMELKHCWEYSKETIGIVVKSVYCNMHGITGPDYKDVKLMRFGVEDYARTQKVNCFSCYDSAITAGLGEWLKTEYPTKSKWEI